MTNSYMNEGEYRPQSKGASFNPVDIIDIVPSLQREQQRQLGAQQSKLNDIARNNETKLANSRKYKDTLRSLGQFSKSLTDKMVGDQEAENKKLAALGENLAYYAGTSSYETLDEQENQLADSNSRYLKTIDSIPNSVMSPEEKQLLRRDSYGHGKYGFETGRLQSEVSRFPEFFAANKSNPDFAVVINGRPVTVATAEGHEERSAAAAALRTKFFEQVGLDGVNNPAVKNKYFFDPLRKMETELLSRESAATVKRLQAEEQDKFSVKLNNNPTAQSFNDFYNVLVTNGKAPGEARKEALKQLARSDNMTAIDAVLDSPFGPNGQTLRGQYSADVKDMLTQRNEEREQIYQLSEYERKVGEREQIKAFDAALEKDAADGTIDVTPEYLAEQASKALADGNKALSEHIKSKIPLTSKSQYQDNIENQVERQLSLGIIPSIAEIQQDSMLTPETKTELINKIEAKQSSSVPSEASKGAEKIIKAGLDRVAGYDRIAGGKKHESLEWAIQTATSRWNAVYTAELTRTNDHEAARKAADDDFKAELNDADGLYKIKDGKTDGGMGIFAGYDMSGKAYGFDGLQREVRDKLKSNPQAALTSDQPLYSGEQAALEKMNLDFRNGGKLTVPSIYYDIQQGSGGKTSVVDLVNSRLKGLGLDELPKEITAVTDETEDLLNSSGFNWQYRPNQVRTDIASIGATGEAIYAQSTPLGDQVKRIVSRRESPTAGYDAINRGQGGDTPGGATARYGRPLTQMTLGEVKALQAQELNAVGKYQFIETTLAEAAEIAGVSDDMLFNEAVQDRIFFVHLDNNGLYGPWEQWWIQQGGPGLATTAAEKETIRRFREQYNPANPWRSARNMRPELQPN